MAAITQVLREKNDHIRFVNDTGANVAQYEFNVFGAWCGVADEAILISAVGSWHVEAGIQVSTTTLHASQNTFATLGQAVYFDTATLTFSDTSTADYHLVGYLIEIKTSGRIVFEKMRFAELVTT